MRILINDRECEADTGDLLLDVAQRNKCHIGYICGGSGICQSCFVYVKQGMDCLSPRTEVEKAFISEKLAGVGGRLACQTTIVRDGSVTVLSRAEHLRRIVVGLNVSGFVTYAQTIGYNVVNQLPSGVGNIVERIRSGHLNPATSIRNVAKGAGQATGLIGRTVEENLPFIQGPARFAGDASKAVYDVASNTLCAVSGGRLHLPGGSCDAHKTQPAIEKVQITARTVKK
ncbi:chlorosome protein J [Prosthecochloris sp. GSB1]|uniref:2Fe-2S iron-sulfur cluster-binding protein n=1 Tax=Prosthecochloris sp. GSB1 TaxID=281093 RepID=UPI000B8CEFCF|nr:2Fe-2S iron-sulfur cluster-binding protein [Prosthecochloris sp. GSB1]ASQ90797.1 chlorosome protein J [Prosthecochloris sp. GSB1]